MLKPETVRSRNHCITNFYSIVTMTFANQFIGSPERRFTLSFTSIRNSAVGVLVWRLLTLSEYQRRKETIFRITTVNQRVKVQTKS